MRNGLQVQLSKLARKGLLPYFIADCRLFGRRQYLPSWFEPHFGHQSIPWERAVTSTTETFIARYSLHDSVWIGIYQEPGTSSAFLALFWNLHECCSNHRFARMLSNPTNRHPLLFVRFENVLTISAKASQHSVGHHESYENLEDLSAGISSSNLTSIGDNSTWTLVDHEGGLVSVEYTGPVKILGLTRACSALPILGNCQEGAASP